MIYNTSNFVSWSSAVAYYRDYADDAEHAVQQKLKAGEIHIGPPATKTGERIIRIDGQKRYAIVEAS